jgi:hypothetical protein
MDIEVIRTGRKLFRLPSDIGIALIEGQPEVYRKYQPPGPVRPIHPGSSAAWRGSRGSLSGTLISSISVPHTGSLTIIPPLAPLCVFMHTLMPIRSHGCHVRAGRTKEGGQFGSLLARR